MKIVKEKVNLLSLLRVARSSKVYLPSNSLSLVCSTTLSAISLTS